MTQRKPQAGDVVATIKGRASGQTARMQSDKLKGVEINKETSTVSEKEISGQEINLKEKTHTRSRQSSEPYLEEETIRVKQEPNEVLSKETQMPRRLVAVVVASKQNSPLEAQRQRGGLRPSPSSDSDYRVDVQPARSDTAGTKKRKRGPNVPNLKPRGRPISQAKKKAAEAASTAKEIEKLRLTITRLQKENLAVIAAKKSAERLGKSLSTENAKLQQSLQACRDDLYKLQPLHQTSDTEIVSQYEQVSQGITSWVEEIMAEMTEEILTNEMNVLTVCRSAEIAHARHLLFKYPSAAELVIHHEIFRILHSEIFQDNVFLTVLGEKFTNLFYDIEDGMRQLEPVRDTKAIRKWRSETLTAFIASPVFPQFESFKARLVTSNIYKHLNSVLPALFNQEAWFDRLNSRVTMPAIKLSHLIQSSRRQYCFVPASPIPREGMQEVAHYKRLDQANLKDVATRRPLKASDRIVSDDDGNIGTLVMILEPRLTHVTQDRARNITLRKEVAVVSLIEPLQRQHKKPRLE
ncbi:hypothetical protein MMC18_001620 [Xylographa bjoerkii]|nr:hypothetical protein [Xylographa bjoerkii]